MATLMLEGGADIRHIQAMLGHVRLETTEIYTQVSIRHLLAIHQACHPGWHNQRSDETNTSRNELLDDTETGSRDRHPTFDGQPAVSREELLAALDQEVEEEIRPGSEPAPPPTGPHDSDPEEPTP